LNYSKKGWDIIADIIRNLSDGTCTLNDYETDNFLQDIATIMDFMCNGKTFKNAIKAYRQEDSENLLWLEEFLEKLEIEL
jgi:ferritin